MTYTRHNITGLAENEGTLGFFQSTFRLTDGILGLSILCVIFFVSFNILSRVNSTRDSLAGSTFLCFGLSIIMMAMGLILPIYTLGLGIFLGLIAFSYVFK